MQNLLIIMILVSLSACATIGANKDEIVTKAVVSEVTMVKYKFVPQVLKIKKGQAVRWINKEKRQYHSVWFEKYGEEESDYLFPNDILEKNFNKTGEFDYRCGPHPEMIGKIIVVE